MVSCVAMLVALKPIDSYGRFYFECSVGHFCHMKYSEFDIIVKEG